MITLDGVSKTFMVPKRTSGLRQAVKSLFAREYSRVEALQNISFSINPGEIVGYIGPNGAGKSTSIKVMSGILVPDRGTCRIMGFTPWQQRTAYVKKIGVVFGQRSQLWWDVPVMDSYMLLKEIYKIPDAEYRTNLSLLTETLDLSPLLTTPVRQLSLGQRMRCEIAASLLHSPELLFFDEPTIGLDAISKLAVRDFIRTINKERGVTVILTTHDMNDIEALAHRILLIGRGRLLYDGTLQQLRGRFGSSKLLTVEYQGSEPPPLYLEGTELLTWEPGKAQYRVDTEQVGVSKVLNSITELLPVLDVSIESPSIEATIAQLYKEFRI